MPFVPVTFYFCFWNCFLLELVCYLQFINYPMKAIPPVYYYCLPPCCSQTPLCRVHIIGFWQNWLFSFFKLILLFSLFQRHSQIYCHFGWMRWCWLAVIGVMLLLFHFCIFDMTSPSFALQKVSCSPGFFLGVVKWNIPSHELFTRCHFMEVLIWGRKNVFVTFLWCHTQV